MTDVRIPFSLNILRTNWWNLTKLGMCINIDKIYIGIITCQFSQIYNRVMALEWCQNPQCFENKSMEFDQILLMHWYWEDVRRDHYTSISQIYNSVMARDWCPNSILWEQIDGIWPHFAYALILTRSRLGLLRVNFRKFITALWLLIGVIISFLLNILRTTGWILTTFCLCIDINNI